MAQQDGLEKPKLRPIQAYPVSLEGREMYALRDLAGSNTEILVTPQILFLLGQFDGNKTLRDIQYYYVQQFGDLISIENLQEIIDQIDQKLLLDSPRYREYYEQLKEEYRKLPSRPAIHRETSYPGDPHKLDSLIHSFFTHDQGPGDMSGTYSSTRPKGIVAPHIDFKRGGPCFAHAYKTIGEAQDIDLFIILGTDHNDSYNYYSLSPKDYETPYGEVKGDREFIERLSSRLHFDAFEDELNHRREHSIEFQTVFLKQLYQNRRDFRIVPILCGSLHPFIVDGKSPQQDEQIHQFIELLSEEIHKSSLEICLIAAVDLSHVGIQFGATSGPTEVEREVIAQEDNQLLERMLKCDAEHFFHMIIENKNHHNICGISPIYTFLSVIQATTGRLLHYDYWHDQDEGSLVSFASMVYY